MALLCRLFSVSRSGYYESPGVAPSPQAEKRQIIAREAIRFHARSKRLFQNQESDVQPGSTPEADFDTVFKGIYGYRKVARGIREEPEIRCAPETVRRVMREERLCARVRHEFVVTTQSSHSLPAAQNILARDFRAEGPNRKRASDITWRGSRKSVSGVQARRGGAKAFFGENAGAATQHGSNA